MLNTSLRVIGRAGHLAGGPVRRLAWNLQFWLGYWNHLEARPADLIDFYGQYCRNGVVLDLGCGEGHLFGHMTNLNLRQYIGVDVSSVAIEKAKARFAGQPAKFFAHDLDTWREPVKANLVVFEESLYYVKNANELVDYALSCLLPGGAVIAIIHDQKRWGALCNLLARHPSIDKLIHRGPRWVGVFTRQTESLPA